MRPIGSNFNILLHDTKGLITFFLWDTQKFLAYLQLKELTHSISAWWWAQGSDILNTSIWSTELLKYQYNQNRHILSKLSEEMH